MLILGVDPGLATTGWGAIQIIGKRTTHIDNGVIRTTSTVSHIARLQTIGDGLRQVTSTLSPDLICIERVFININPKSSLLLGEARGVAIMALLSAKAPLIELSALQIKQAITGIGRATKKQVAQMVGRLLNITVDDLPHDCTDALACALAAISAQDHRTGRRRPAKRWKKLP